MNIEIVAGLILAGLGINLVVILRFTWQQGHWTGKVTTLLDEHQKDLTQHDKRIGSAEQDIAHIKGSLTLE